MTWQWQGSLCNNNFTTLSFAKNSHRDKVGYPMVCEFWKIFKRVEELLYLKQPTANCQNVNTWANSSQRFMKAQYHIDLKNNAVFPCQLASQPSKPRLQNPPNPFSVKLQAGVRPRFLSSCYPWHAPPPPCLFLVTFIQKVPMPSWLKLFFKKHSVIRMFKWAYTSRFDQHHLLAANSIFILTQ